VYKGPLNGKVFGVSKSNNMALVHQVFYGLDALAVLKPTARHLKWENKS